MRMSPLRLAVREANKRLNKSGETHLVVENLARSVDYSVISMSEWDGWDLKVLYAAVPPHLNLSVSPGNIKLSYIPSVSLPPPRTCADKRRPCFGSKHGVNCYAMPNMYLLRTSVRNAWDRNWRILESSRDLFFIQISAYIQAWKPKMFRFHVGGGVPDQDYLNRVLQFCQIHSHTRFLIFEKGYDIGLRFGVVPANLAVILSTWPGMDLPSDEYSSFRKAWIADDPRVPDGAIECDGGCTECEKCWDINMLGQDVVFPRH